MNKASNLYVMISLLLCFMLFPNDLVEAKEHRLESLHIHTYIHEDGSATITEKRQATLNEGTENYDVIEDLGKSTIINFTVSEKGKTYEFIDHWDIDSSREEKAYKNGVIKTASGYELVWGIGEYGYHEYILEYTVTDFIKQLKDSQMLFWRYVNDATNIPPEQLTIEIETDKQLNADDEKIWGFGFDGDIHFEKGNVIATSHSPLTSSNYATVLIKFAENQFSTTDVIDKTFAEIQDEAFAESDYKNDEHNDDRTISHSTYTSSNNSSVWLLVLILSITLSPFIIFGMIMLFILLRVLKYWKHKRKFKGEYERQIPYDGSFIDLYELLTSIRITKFENIIAAYLLKWTREERIDIKNEDIGILFKAEVPVIYFIRKDIPKDTLESDLFQMLIDAADMEDKLERKDLVKWIEKNRKKIRTWEKDVKQSSIEALTSLGAFRKIEKRTFLFKRNTYETTEQGNKLEEHVYKFVNYLRDYSLLNEHEPINVKLWDELMIWAAVLGVTEEVYKQFRQLYPAYTTESSYSAVSITATSSLSRSISDAKSYVSSSSGGGGSTSGGGGGGSFGGGSGGGTR